MSDERLLLTWFGQFMTEPRYPELVAGEEIPEEELFGASRMARCWCATPAPAWPGARSTSAWCCSPAARAYSCPGSSGELLKLVCSADALHLENLGQWLADDDARKLLAELVKQGSLEFADE